MGAIFGIVGSPVDGWLAGMGQRLAHRGDGEMQSASTTELAGIFGFLRGSSDGVFQQCGNAILAVAGRVVDGAPRLDSSDQSPAAPAPESLRGAFVLAHWDARAGILTLIRDGAGRRTIYHAQHEGRFVFATEPKALHQLPGFNRRIRPSSVAQYLTFSFVPGEPTMLEGINELPAGHILRWHAREQRMEVQRWFFPERAAPLPENTDVPELFREHMRGALEALRPPEGAPVAAFLSGGLDSSAVLAELAETPGERPTAFSISFGEKLPNELGFARSVASRLDLKHEIFTIRPKDFSRHLRQLVWHLDDPIGDPVTMPNFELARHVAGQGFRHVWNGEGGDPCFGGPKNLYMLLSHWYGVPGQNGNFREEAYLRSFRRAYEEMKFLLRPEFRAQVNVERDLFAPLRPMFQTEEPPRLLDKLMAINMRFKGAHLILPKVERLLGAHGVTPLSPLFDEAMLELSFALPEHWKLRGGIDKVAIREAYRPLLPTGVIGRPKFGMRVPVQAWLQKELRKMASHLLSRKRLEDGGIFDPVRVRQLLDFDTEEGAGRYGMRLWMLIMFELWREEVGAEI